MQKLKKTSSLFKASILQKALLAGLALTVCMSFTGFQRQCEGISSKILRLHILANSDSDADQALKIKIRDRILENSHIYFENSENLESAKANAALHLDDIKQDALNVIFENGYTYDVSVEIGKTSFNTRDYDGFSLPAGEYEAVRVLVGEAKGKNWWCVLFPAVCLPAASSAGELSDALDSDEYEIATNKPRYEFRFKTLEIFNQIIKNK